MMEQQRRVPAAGRAITQSRFELAAIVAGIFLGVSLATRIVLAVIQHAVAKDGLGRVLAAFLAGEVFDLLAALWIIAPLMLWLAVIPERRFRTRWQLVVLSFGTAVSVYLALFVAVAEYFFFEEFNGRFNFVAVDYLIFPTEVVNNIWQSYPTATILTVLTLIVVAIMWRARPAIRRVTQVETPARLRVMVLAAYAVLLAVLTLFVSPALARVSSDRALNEIALNGYYSFWLALLGQDAPYEGLYATRPASDVFPRLHRLLAEHAADTSSFVAGSIQRRIENAPPERRWNVVVVLEESLGSEFIGTLYPRERSLTPRFDSLITEGLLLDNAFSTGNRTIRALEATTASLPPLPGISIVRRDQSKDLFTLPALMRSRGYATMFIYGGRALFDGMGSYMRNNGMERVIEQSDFGNPGFTTAWGVADEAIFDKAITQFDSLHAAKKPFYALVLSVSNHRPYTYPAGRIGSDPNQKRRENVVEYADYSLGRFMRQARAHGWFDSTVFVLMGDHGARVYGAQEIPLASYEVPILLYAPKLIPAGQRVHTIASSMDMPPTILALLGVRYTSRWFGRDVLHLAPDEGRALMTHNNEIALMQRDTLAVLGLRGSSSMLRYDRAARQQLQLQSAPRDLIDDAIAYFDGADKMYRSGKLRF